MLRLPKKFILLLALGAALVGLLFIAEIRQARRITVSSSEAPILDPTPVDIPIALSDFILGNPGAPLSIVEFIDLGSKESRQVHAELAAVVRAHPTYVRLVFKHAPGRPGLWGAAPELLHRGAWCAGAERQFWQWLDWLAAAPAERFKEADMRAHAAALPISLVRWSHCLSAPEAIKAVAADQALGKQLGVEAPTVFINNFRLARRSEVNLTDLIISLVSP